MSQKIGRFITTAVRTLNLKMTNMCNMKEKDDLEVLDVNGRIIFKWTVRYVRMWI
jgi:hypothetical protein